MKIDTAIRESTWIPFEDIPEGLLSMSTMLILQGTSSNKFEYVLSLSILDLCYFVLIIIPHCHYACGLHGTTFHCFCFRTFEEIC